MSASWCTVCMLSQIQQSQMFRGNTPGPTKREGAIPPQFISILYIIRTVKIQQYLGYCDTKKYRDFHGTSRPTVIIWYRSTVV